jgi:hippurate hydrolase
MALQAIVSRRTDPRETAAIHVGRIQGGDSRNTIAEKVVLELSLRAQGVESLERLVAGVAEAIDGLARAAGMGPELEPELRRAAFLTPSVANDARLCGLLTSAFQDWLGLDRVKACRPMLGSEDFSRFGDVDPPIPLALFFLGVTEPELIGELQADPIRWPRLHTATFAPAAEPALATGLRCFTAAALALLGRHGR